MIFRCPNSGVINTMYIEFVAPVRYIEPDEENKLEKPMYVFFVRMMSGYTICFEEEYQEIADNTRRDILKAMSCE